MKNIFALSLVALAAPSLAQVPPAVGKPAPPTRVVCKQEVVTEDVSIKEFILEKTKDGWTASFRDNHKNDGKAMGIPDLNTCRFYKADPRVFYCYKGDGSRYFYAGVETEKLTTEKLVWGSAGEEFKSQWLRMTFHPQGVETKDIIEASFSPEDCNLD